MWCTTKSRLDACRWAAMRSFVALATALCLCLAEAPLSEAARDPNIRLTVNSTSIRDGDMIKVTYRSLVPFPPSMLGRAG